jgi:hypothetical protein
MFHIVITNLFNNLFHELVSVSNSQGKILRLMPALIFYAMG